LTTTQFALCQNALRRLAWLFHCQAGGHHVADMFWASAVGIGSMEMVISEGVFPPL
jgi:hypothetical protein